MAGFRRNPHHAQSSDCVKCYQDVLKSTNLCVGALPPEVHPLDPKNPTQAELDKAKSRAAASSKCNKDANDGTIQCKAKFSCPP